MAASVPGLLDKFSLDDLVGLLVGKFDIYVTDLFTRLRGIFNKAEPTKFSLGSNGDEYPEVSHFLRDSPPLVKLFEYMTSQPVGVRYDCKQFPGSPKRASHSFSYGSTTLNFAFDDKYMVKHSLNTKLLSSDVYSLLQGLLAVEMMIVGAAEKCVDLTAYRGRVTDEHLWFKDNVVDR
uniref:Putative MP n=1 Tax=Mycosphaerella tobamovirus B TaxID=2592789 RepID=A0A7G3W8T7_9VIRU|nr:putative MP [Mycosphaerella tobamovirus B]